MPGVIFILFFAVAIILMVMAHEREKKRRAAFAAFAAENGWDYTHEKDTRFDDVFRELPFVGQGSHRYLRHRIRGRHRESRIQIGEYHYQVTTHNGKTSSTHHYFSTLVMLEPPFRLKELSIRREGLFDKFKAAFGWDDIDFASAEFSRKYHVSAPDRDWAFAFIQPATMDRLMRTEGVEFHIRNGWLVLRTKDAMRVEELPGLLRTADAMLDQVPDFVQQESA